MSFAKCQRAGRRVGPAGGRLLALTGLAGLTAAVAGCRSPGFDGARHHYYDGDYHRAARTLDALSPGERNSILFLMERGMVLQAAGHYAISARDLVEAADRIERFEAYSVSEGAGSLVINNRVYTFKGKPYERTLLHAFTAKDFFALSQWESAAVEARRIIEALSEEQRGGHPDDPYSRYVAGLCLELINDVTNARVQYRKAAALVSDVTIDPETGRLHDGSEPAPPAPGSELVCLIQVGRAAVPGTSSLPSAMTVAPIHADLYADGEHLGRSYTISDTWRLAALTAEEESIRSAAKTAARLAIKETIAQTVASETEEEWGHVTRLVLFGLLEQPDLRHWGTLPRWLQVARVPCPRELSGYHIVFRDQTGGEIGRRFVKRPLARRGRLFVSFCRDADSVR